MLSAKGEEAWAARRLSEYLDGITRYELAEEQYREQYDIDDDTEVSTEELDRFIEEAEEDRALELAEERQERLRDEGDWYYEHGI